MTTHVLMITDMSGSMWPLVHDVRGGFNAYIADLRTQPDTDFKITVCLFDTEVEFLCKAAPLDQVPPLTAVNYHPRGGTALLDAVATTVGLFRSAAHGLVLPDAPGPIAPEDKVLVVIQTDGNENSSREYSYDKVAALIAECEASGQWNFIYLGAGAQAWNKGAQLGVRAGMQVNTAATSAGTRSTYDSLTRGTIAYAQGASGQAVSSIIADGASAD